MMIGKFYGRNTFLSSSPAISPVLETSAVSGVKFSIFYLILMVAQRIENDTICLFNMNN